MMTRASMVTALVAVALLSGCEDSPLTAGKDYTMTLVAKPGTVVIDPASGIDLAQASIVATILNANGVPQQNITVVFSNKGGTLASGKSGVKTDSGGIASDTLTVTANDPAESEVTATSASLTQSIKVLKSTVPVNRPPTAGIAAAPQTEQAKDKQVIFDGTGSTDPDTGDFITMYKWVITSTNPDPDKGNPFVAEGPGVSGVSFPSDAISAFHNIQELNVTLYVTDDPDAPAQYAAALPNPANIAYRAQQTIPYAITAVRCEDNVKPTAVIAGADTQQVFGFAGTSVNFLLDGTLSSDPETAIETYTWTCGNGTIPIPQGNGSKAVCKYFVDQTPRTYTATLVVTDRGTGQLTPIGAYECAAESVPDTVQVVVSPLAGGG